MNDSPSEVAMPPMDDDTSEALDGALLEASESGDLTGVLALLEAGAATDGDEGDEHYTPLMLASRHMHLACVWALLTAGAEIDRAAFGSTALSCTTYWGQVDVVRRLLDAGANQDVGGLELIYSGLYGAHLFNLQILQLLRAYAPNRDVELCPELQAVPGCQAFLDATSCWMSQLHFHQFLPAERVAELLAGGADVHASDGGEDAPTPIGLARTRLQTAGAPGEANACAELVVSADPLPWSEGTHELFPPRGRARAVELLLAGHLLAQRYGTALLDVWLAHVMPRAVYM